MDIAPICYLILTAGILAVILVARAHVIRKDRP